MSAGHCHDGVSYKVINLAGNYLSSIIIFIRTTLLQCCENLSRLIATDTADNICISGERRYQRSDVESEPHLQHFPSLENTRVYPGYGREDAKRQ